MKQLITYLYILMLGVAGVMMTSCSSDDIEIELSGTTLRLNVNTVDLYDEFGITESIKSVFLSIPEGSTKPDAAIGIWAFLYNEAGELISQDFKSAQTFGNMTFDFGQFKIGKYTAVLVETLVDSQTYDALSWNLSGTEDLSTLSLDAMYIQNLWFSVVGKCVQEIEIKPNEGAEYNCSIKGMGALTSCYFANFADANYSEVGCWTENFPTGRLLSPEYTGESMFKYDQYSDQNNMWVRYNSSVKTNVEYQVFTVYTIECRDMVFGLCATAPEYGNEWAVWGGNDKVTFKDGGYYYRMLYYLGVEGYAAISNLYTKFDDMNDWYNEVTEIFFSESERPVRKSKAFQIYNNHKEIGKLRPAITVPSEKNINKRLVRVKLVESTNN